jgi:hypothetical protein
VSACSLIGTFLKGKAQVVRLLHLAGHPELEQAIPERTGAGTVREYGFTVGKLIATGMSPRQLLDAYSQVIVETIATEDELKDWLKRNGGSIDLRRELGVIGRLIAPGYDAEGEPDGNDYQDTRWYPALLKLIVQVRDETKAGNVVLTPDELDAQVAAFQRGQAG